MLFQSVIQITNGIEFFDLRTDKRLEDGFGFDLVFWRGEDVDEVIE